MASLLAVGCSEGPTLPADADAQLVLGQDVFASKCARCHGLSGGGGIGPSVQDVETRLTDTEQLEVVVSGRKAMPRFDSVLSEEEIAAVVRYTREIL